MPPNQSQLPYCFSKPIVWNDLGFYWNDNTKLFPENVYYYYFIIIINIIIKIMYYHNVL